MRTSFDELEDAEQAFLARWDLEHDPEWLREREEYENSHHNDHGLDGITLRGGKVNSNPNRGEDEY